MKHCFLLPLLLALWCMHVRGAPLENDGIEQGSCEDPQAKGAADQALAKINADRKEGYVFGLHRLSNVHMTKHGANGVLFYLTIDVVETNCSVLSRKDWKDCEARPIHDTPVYGQCKATIFINKPHRVVRLYKYNCVVRPVPAVKVYEVCPDCPTHIGMDNSEVQKTVTLSLEKFNKESGLSKHFSLLKVTRAVSGMGMLTHYNVEYIIQETVCPRSTEAVTAGKCPFIECEFSHKGFCKAGLSYPPMTIADASVYVECEIYEPEAAERQKKLHLLEHDHSHSDTHAHNPAHDQAHASNDQHAHDHVHDHTKGHAHHDKTLVHSDNTEHHHVHDHAAGSGQMHAHDHSHDHGHGHNHTHSHHAKAHDHSGDSPNQHHDYKHAEGMHSHKHDHELALDHDHKHSHLHEHEHHHHHHDHIHEKEAHDNPEGMVRVLPAMDADQPMILPSFPDAPAAGPEVGVVLPLKPDPQIPDEMEPTILPFPTAVSAQCHPQTIPGTLVEQMLREDPMFKVAA